MSYWLFFVALLFSTAAFANLEIDRTNCAASISATINSGAERDELVSRLISAYGKPKHVAENLVKAVERRKVFFSQVDTQWFTELSDLNQLRELDELWHDLLVADLAESLPDSLSPRRTARTSELLPPIRSQRGLPYLLDILTLPSEAILDWMATENFSGPLPIFEGQRLDPWPLERARARAVKIAREKGFSYIMENHNGTFTPLANQPAVGTFFSIHGEVDLSSSFEGPAPESVQYAFINDSHGGLAFVDKRPTAPGTECLIFDERGEKGRVIGHFIVGPPQRFQTRKQRRGSINLLADEWDRMNSISREMSVVHRIAIYTILDRLAVDTLGIIDESELATGREQVRKDLQDYMKLHRSAPFIKAIGDYLRDHDPYRFTEYAPSDDDHADREPEVE